MSDAIVPKNQILALHLSIHVRKYELNETQEYDRKLHLVYGAPDALDRALENWVTSEYRNPN